MISTCPRGHGMLFTELDDFGNPQGFCLFCGYRDYERKEGQSVMRSLYIDVVCPRCGKSRPLQKNQVRKPDRICFSCSSKEKASKNVNSPWRYTNHGAFVKVR